MSQDRFAAIDVGTNSVLLLVAERTPAGFRPLLEQAEITRLGRGVDATRSLSEASIEATVGAISRFAAEARSIGVRAIACVATSAARDASNGGVFFDEVKRRAGIDAEVIPGEEEARLSYLAAEADFGPGPKTVLDIGGGSTEVIHGERGSILFSHSYDVGSVRLTERHVRSDPPRASERSAVEAEVERVLAQAPPAPAGSTLVGIAGTVTTLFAVSRRIDPYRADQVQGQVMSRSEIQEVADRLWDLPLAERQRLPGLQPGRADVIPAGASLLLGAMTRFEKDSLLVSDHGVRWGLLTARFGTAS